MTATDETEMLPAAHAAHAMNMIDAFYDLGCQIGHGVSEDAEIVLGPVFLPNGRNMSCSMSLHDTGWSYYFNFADFGLPNMRGDEVWSLPEELAAAIRAVLSAIAVKQP